MQVVGSLLGRIILMILLGFVLKRKNIINDEFQKGLANLLLKVVLPLNVLASSEIEFTQRLQEEMILSAGIAIGYYLAAIVISKYISTKLHMPEQSRKIFVMMCAFANVGFIGFPLIQELYGEEAFILVVVYNLIYQLFLVTVGIKMLDPKGRIQKWEFLKDPLLLVSVLSIIIFLSPFRLPDIIQDTCETVGDMMVPISMIIIGCDMEKENIRDIFANKYSYVVIFLRLFVFPIIMLAVLRLFLDNDRIISPMVLLTALPCGSLNVILAQQYQCGHKFASGTVILSMILMVITVPIILLLLNIM